jgi:hypothetical protein
MTWLTAYEILTNPNDLSFCVKKPEGSDKYAVLISRGPGHRFKALLSSKAILSKEEALDAVQEILDAVLQLPSSSAARVAEEGTLNKEQIKKIMDDLKRTGESATYK